VYFGLLLDKKKVGVAESEKRVAAIFLLPVWALEPLKRSFLPHSGSYGCLVADGLTAGMHWGQLLFPKLYHFL